MEGLLITADNNILSHNNWTRVQTCCTQYWERPLIQVLVEQTRKCVGHLWPHCVVFSTHLVSSTLPSTFCLLSSPCSLSLFFPSLSLASYIFHPSPHSVIFPSFLFLWSPIPYLFLSSNPFNPPTSPSSTSVFFVLNFLRTKRCFLSPPSSPVWNVRVRGAARQQSFLSFPGHFPPTDKSTSGFPLFFAST